MKKIYFRDGSTMEINIEVAKAIRQKIIDGCGQFQIFSDENDEPWLFINLKEIVFIK
jgi:hypothetical protein